MMITSAELNLYQNDFLWHINPYVRKAFYDRLMPHQVIGERIIYDYELSPDVVSSPSKISNTKHSPVTSIFLGPA